MPDWTRFTPSDFEYDFEKDKLFAHGIEFEEAVECFFSNFQIRRNKSYQDRYQLIGTTVGGRDMNDKRQLSEEEIDEIVTSQADDETAWEDAIEIKTNETAVSLSPEMAKRAAFFSKLHHKSNAEEWLQTIIQERIQFEEAAFTTIKQAMKE